MSVLKIKDENGNWIGITSIKGEKGDKGDKGDVVSPEEIGAAPDGYGLGTYATSVDDANNISATGFYYTSTNVPTGAGRCYILHQQMDVKNASQFAITHASPRQELTAFRSLYNGNWTSWKWIHPQMKAGEEYLTAERIGDKFIHKRYNNGIIEYRFDGESEWHEYASVVGAVSKSGDTVNGDLKVKGALSVERSDTNRKARTIAYNNTDKEVDFQNYGDDANYVSLRVATEAKGLGDAMKITQMNGGQFSAFTILHTGNKEKIFTYGTEDIEAGTPSPYPNGTLHFVYE